MTTYPGSFRGLTFGDGGDAEGRVAVSAVSGFFGAAGDLPVAIGLDGGAHAGRAVDKLRPIRITGSLLGVTDDEELDELRDRVAAAFSPADPSPLVIRDRMCWATAIECDPGYDPSWPGQERTSEWSATLTTVDVARFSADPVPVSRSAASSHSFTATNSGTRTVGAAALRGAWSLVLTASGGAVTAPWVQIGGRRVTWQGLTVPSGESLTVSRDRQSILSPTAAPVNGYARTPGEAAPHWPVLAPGASTVTMGCASGSFSVAWSHWSAW